MYWCITTVVHQYFFEKKVAKYLHIQKSMLTFVLDKNNNIMKVYTIISQHYEEDKVSSLVTVNCTFTDYCEAVHFLVELDKDCERHLELNTVRVETNPFRHSGRIYQIIENVLL